MTTWDTLMELYPKGGGGEGITTIWQKNIKDQANESRYKSTQNIKIFLKNRKINSEHEKIKQEMKRLMLSIKDQSDNWLKKIKQMINADYRQIKQMTIP